MIGWIIGLVMATMAGITGLSVAVALRLHFLDERHLRERDNLQAQLADRDETIAMQAKEHGRMIELHAKAAKERDEARSQRDRLNTRNAELVEEAGKLAALVNDPQASRLALALEDSEHELDECRHERQMLRLRLAEALSKPRTVPIKRIDATKPRPPQKEQEG